MQPLMFAPVPPRTRGSWVRSNSIGEILKKGLKTFSLRIHRYVGEETSLIFQ